MVKVARQLGAGSRGSSMEVVNTHCAGLDVHKKTVVACVITPEFKAVRTFSTMTSGLLELADWLGESQVTQVAMESTGVFWKPVYNLLLIPAQKTKGNRLKTNVLYPIII